MAAGPLRLFVRDARGQEPVPRLVAALPRGGLSVGRLAERLRSLLGEQVWAQGPVELRQPPLCRRSDASLGMNVFQGSLQLALDGEPLHSAALARSVLHDGAVVDVVADSVHGALHSEEAVEPAQSSAPAERPPKAAASAPARRARLDFLTPALRQQLFEPPPPRPPPAAEAKAPELLEPSRLEEEPREKVGLRLVPDRAPAELRWRPAVVDEVRRSFAAHLPQALGPKDADRFLAAAVREVDWQQPEGRWGPIPRKTAWLTAGGCRCRYGYGGLRIGSEPFPAWLKEVTALCMPLCGLPDEKDWPDSCNLNLYEDGDHSVGWHADDEFLFQGKFTDCLIISLSLGATRWFELKTAAEPFEMHRLLLRSGDLCTMEGLMQKHYLHRVPKERHYCEPRVNLTWRWIASHEPRCGLQPTVDMRKRHPAGDAGDQGPRAKRPKTEAPQAAAPRRKRPSRPVEMERDKVLAMPAEVRARWLADAMKAVAASELDPSSVFPLAADPEFAAGVNEALGARMFRVLRGNSRLFSEEQARVLQEECAVAQRFASAAQTTGTKTEGGSDSIPGTAEASQRTQEDQMNLRLKELEDMKDSGEQQRRCALFANLVGPLLPIVARALHPDGIDFLEEGLEMLTYLTSFCSTPIPTALWGPFPRLYQAVCGKSTASLQLPEVLEGGWAPDFMTNILEPMLNYVARGPVEVIFSGTWSEGNMTYADMVFNMVKKVLHMPGVGSEKDAAAATELATALFAHAAPPVADAWLPAYFAEFWKRVSEVETRDLRQALLVAFATQMWYNTELFLRCTEQSGVTAQLFEVWMNKIGSLKRLRHRKVALLGLVQLLRMGCAQALPANLAQGLPHLVCTLAVQSKETLRLRHKAASRPDEEEDTDSEDGTADQGQVDQVLRKLQMASENDDDNEDNDSEALSDEGFDGMVHAAGGKLVDLNAQRLSRLDRIDELAALREVLQQASPDMQRQFEAWVGGSLHEWIATLTTETARSK
ncbi:unnamed protein product [Symbiodinium natans]|uniref:Fe2OG dioxygenase domain-containing protein n=1 Tax=Symbiodinium natans TaxID=878477 RepID=A0A812NEL0_9DINO|nr:unnamed protein product [Symbiodinium natans]